MEVYEKTIWISRGVLGFIALRELLVERQLLPHPLLALAQGHDPSSDCGHMLAVGQIEAVTVDGGIAPSTSASKPCVPLLRHTAPQ
jgi:hypothetical protein